MAGVCGRVLLWLVYAGECYYGECYYGSCMRASAIMSGVFGRVLLCVV